MSEQPFQANDPAQVKKKVDKAKFRREQQEADLKTLLGLAEFRRYIWRHINETCGVMQSPASSNGTIQSGNIGMGDVGRRLWTEIEAVDPMVIPKMMIEYHEAQKNG